MSAQFPIFLENGKAVSLKDIPNYDFNEFYATQIKEKFGVLRFYTGGAYEEVHKRGNPDTTDG